MSRHQYLIKRDENVFEASSWEELCQWAREGRIKLGDEFHTPSTSSWRAVSRDPTLSGLIPKRERLILKRGDQKFGAPDYELIQKWAAQGQVSPEDLIFSSYTQLWARVTDLPSIMKHIPSRIIVKTEERAQRRRQILEGEGGEERVSPVSRENLEEGRPAQAEERPPLDEEVILTNDPSNPPSIILTDSAEAHRTETEEKDTDAAIAPLRPSREDVEKICAPSYDAARLFLILRELRPLERLEGQCKLNSLKLNCADMTKREAIQALHDALQNHINAYLPDEVSAASIGAKPLFQALHRLQDRLMMSLEHVGQVAEERFVVGNENRPKVTPEEALAMQNLQSAFEALVQATKRFKTS